MVAFPSDARRVHVDRHECIGNRQPFGRQAEVGSQDADDRSRLAVEHHHPADDTRIGSEALPPARIGDDRHFGPIARFICWRERPAERGLHAQHVEQRPAGAADWNLRRISDSGKVRRQDDVLRERLEGARVPPPVLEMLLVHLERRNPSRELIADLFDGHQPMRFLVREWLQQDAVDDGEDRGGGADRQREGKDDGQGVRAVAAESATGVTQIEEQKAHVTLDGWIQPAVD